MKLNAHHEMTFAPATIRPLSPTAWRARINTHSNKVVALAADPAVIDSAGLPRPLDGPAAARELNLLQVCNNMLGGLPRHLAQLKDLLNPGFISANAYAYLFRHGLLYVLMSLGAGIKAQFGRRCR